MENKSLEQASRELGDKRREAARLQSQLANLMKAKEVDRDRVSALASEVELIELELTGMQKNYDRIASNDNANR